MRYGLIVLWMLFGLVTSATGQVSVGIGLPGVSIGINLPIYPELVPVPGYPVYYAPQMNSNYFFYDGMYWVYQGDNWYASSWYNGPWGLVDPEVVPLFVLRIPVSFYRDPPGYFRGWRADAPPRWGEHWGNQWEQRRSGWDRWNRSSAPARAPLPVYQRQYSGDRYPRVEQQQALRSQNYRYQPRDAVVRQHLLQQTVQKAPAPSQPRQQGAPKQSSPGQQDIRRSNPPSPLQQSQPQQGAIQGQRKQLPSQQGAVQGQRQQPPSQQGAVQGQRQQPQPQQGAVQAQRQQPQPQQRAVQAQRQQPQPQPQQGAVQAQRQQPQSHEGAAQRAPQEPGRGQGQAKDREKGQ